MSKEHPFKKIKELHQKEQLSPSLLFKQEGNELKELFQKQPIDKISKYQIIEEIGRGGMGCVYKAYDPQMNRDIALKTMLVGIAEKELQRFAIEAKAMAKFNHPNIVRIYDIGKDKNTPFITMDFIEGQSLEQYLQNTPLNVRKFSQLMLKIANATQYSHNKGIIHRDLKPANIMLDQNIEPYITDFGLAKVISSQESLSKKGAIIGTPQYMSPQQAQGQQLNHLSDVYALGAIYYRMLAGKPMIAGKNVAKILFKVINEKPVLLRQINNKLAKDLEIICYKATVKETNKRYQSAKEFAQDIERFLHGEIIQARHANILERSWHHIRKNKLSIAISTFCVLLLFFGQSLLNSYQSKKLKKQVDVHLNRAQKTIAKADKLISKRKQMELYSNASNDLEKTLALKMNLEIKTKYFQLKEKIANLAKEQQNDLLAYVIFKQCKKHGVAKADYLLKKLESEQKQLKQRHITFIQKTMGEIDSKVYEAAAKDQEASFKQQNQIIDWYVFKIVQINKLYVLEKLLEYFKNGNKWQRMLAVRAIGRLGNRYTKFAGKDSVEWLAKALEKFKEKKDILNNEQELEEIIWALGWLQDQRVNDLVYKKRWLAGENSLLWIKTKMPYKWIPLGKKATKNIEELVLRGNIKQEKGHYREAIADYNKAIALNPKFSGGYSNRGNSYHELKQYQNAIADFNKAIALNPRYSNAYNNRGNIYNELKKYQNAIVDFNKAIAFDPKNANAYYNRGNSYNELKEYQKAIIDYSKAISLNPRFVNAYYNRGNSYRARKEHQKAIIDYSKAIALNPKYSQAYNNRGVAYLNLKQYQKAYDNFQMFLKLSPRHPIAPKIIELVNNLRRNGLVK